MGHGRSSRSEHGPAARGRCSVRCDSGQQATQVGPDRQTQPGPELGRVQERPRPTGDGQRAPVGAHRQAACRGTTGPSGSWRERRRTGASSRADGRRATERVGPAGARWRHGTRWAGRGPRGHERAGTQARAWRGPGTTNAVPGPEREQRVKGRPDAAPALRPVSRWCAPREQGTQLPGSRTRPGLSASPGRPAVEQP